MTNGHSLVIFLSLLPGEPGMETTEMREGQGSPCCHTERGYACFLRSRRVGGDRSDGQMF